MKNFKEKWTNMSTKEQMEFIRNAVVIAIAVAYIVYVILTWNPGQLDDFWENLSDSSGRHNAYRVGRQIAEHFIN